MPNPVIIFVRSEKVGLVDKTFPIGLPITGGLDAPVQEADYAVLLLDDTAPAIPNSVHTNREGISPLLIVLHGGSEHHKTLNGLPSEWGKPSICETFSHIPGDSIFREIQELLSNTSQESIEAFAKRRLEKSYLAWLDNLGAICQIVLIQSDHLDDNDTIIDQSLQQKAEQLAVNIGSDFSRDFWDQDSWSHALDVVKREAQKFAA